MPFFLFRVFGQGGADPSRKCFGLGGVLQTSNIHLAVCEPGKVTETLAALKASPATARAKAKYVLATDGETLEAEELESGETVACDYPQFPDCG